MNNLKHFVKYSSRNMATVYKRQNALNIVDKIYDNYYDKVEDFYVKPNSRSIIDSDKYNNIVIASSSEDDNYMKYVLKDISKYYKLPTL